MCEQVQIHVYSYLCALVFQIENVKVYRYMYSYSMMGKVHIAIILSKCFYILLQLLCTVYMYFIVR